MPTRPPPRQVFAVFGEMRKHGVRADRAAYNALINACAEAGDAARAEGALGQVSNRNP